MELRPRGDGSCPRVLSLPLLLLAALLWKHVPPAAAAAAAAATTRGDFPEGFVFGAGTSAYQVEGAWAEDGKKPSIWDTYTHSGYSTDHATADVTADQYHHYKEDVKLMHDMGLDAYRFSISWPRLIPDGRGAVNPKGLAYYNSLIDELLKYGIQPHVTIYHFDLPQALQDEYNGLLSPRIIDDFTAYADVCFSSFGDRVKHWSTVNEPNIDPVAGYDQGFFPPRRCSYPFGGDGSVPCAGGNSTTEPYAVAHHLLLAHASAVALYRRKYQGEQGGRIGLTLLAWWYAPATQKPEDAQAAARAIDFTLGWFMHPLVYGDYPAVMRRNVGSRLPVLTAQESAMVRGSFDFVGINQYGAILVEADLGQLKRDLRDYYADAAFNFVTQPFQSRMRKQKHQVSSHKNNEAPWALSKVLEHLRIQYGNPPVMIHENGAGHDPDPSGGFLYDDGFRAHFLQVYIEALLGSVRNGSDVRGYFVWSLMDVFEYLYAYTFRFGLYGVDFAADDRTRYARSSARWYAGFLRGGGGGDLVVPASTTPRGHGHGSGTTYSE